MAVNTKITVDDDGFVWIREYESFKRVKTTVNVHDISEFRRDDMDEKCFYVICNDNTGFMIERVSFTIVSMESQVDSELR